MIDTKFSTEEAAAYLGVSVRTLSDWRAADRGPTYYKPMSKNIYYFKSDIDAWIKSANDEAQK